MTNIKYPNIDSHLFQQNQILACAILECLHHPCQILQRCQLDSSTWSRKDQFPMIKGESKMILLLISSSSSMKCETFDKLPVFWDPHSHCLVKFDDICMRIQPIGVQIQHPKAFSSMAWQNWWRIFHRFDNTKHHQTISHRKCSLLSKILLFSRTLPKMSCWNF